MGGGASRHWTPAIVLLISQIMLRLLLSFLVLMSGLAAAGPEGAARAFEARPQVVLVLSDAGAARVSAHVVAHAREITRPAQPRLIEVAAVLAVAQVVPAVHVGVDRARQ
jgi:hypothetical protein